MESAKLKYIKVGRSKEYYFLFKFDFLHVIYLLTISTKLYKV